MKYTIKNLALLFILGLICSACGSSGVYTKSSPYHVEDYTVDKSTLIKKSESGLEDEEVTVDRKIIKNASIQLKVDHPDSVFKNLDVIAKLNKGYISHSSESYAAITVESSKLEEALEMISKLGKVKEKSISTQDVTANYTDLKIRLDNAEKARKRYLELLNKSEKVSDILPIEKELERITGNIERMKGQLKLMNHQLAYSKISVYWQKKTKPGPLGYVFLGVYKAVKVLFVRN